MKTVFLFISLLTGVAVKAQNNGFSDFKAYMRSADYAIEFNLGNGGLFNKGLNTSFITYYNAVFHLNRFNFSTSITPTTINDHDVFLSNISFGYNLQIANWLTFNPRIGFASSSVATPQANEYTIYNDGFFAGLTVSKELFKNPKHKMMVGVAFDYYSFNFEDHPLFTNNSLFQLGALIGYKFYFGKVD